MSSTWEQFWVRGVCVISHIRVLCGAVQHKCNNIFLWMRVDMSNASSRKIISVIVLKFVFYSWYCGLFLWAAWGLGPFFLKINKSLLNQEFGGEKKWLQQKGRKEDEGNEGKKRNHETYREGSQKLVLFREPFHPKQQNKDPNHIPYPNMGTGLSLTHKN